MRLRWLVALRKERILEKGGRLSKRANLMEGGIWNFFLSLSRAGHSEMLEMFRGESIGRKNRKIGGTGLIGYGSA